MEKPSIRTRLSALLALCVAVLLTAVSCDEAPATNNRLDMAESVMQQHPDSALSILEAIPDASITTAEGRARYALLISRARHRCYIDETDDSLISTAVEYYTLHPSTSPFCGYGYKMLALYHQGVIRENDNNLIKALQSYLRAEAEAIPAHDHYFLGYIYRHFSLLYENINAGRESVYYGKKSYEEFSKAGTEGNIAYAANELGHAFSVYCEYDSALVWADKCLALPFTSRDSLLRADALRLAGDASARLGRHDKAIGYFRRLHKTAPTMFRPHDAARLAMSYHTLGRSGEAYDVCRAFLGADTTTSAVPHEILYARGETDAAYHSVRRTLDLHSKTSENIARQDLTRALAEFREQEIIHEIDRRHKSQLTWILGTSLTLAICIIIFLVLSNRVKRNRKALDHAMLKMEILNEDLHNQLNNQKALMNEKERVSRNLDLLTRQHEQLKLDLEHKENENNHTINNYCQLLEYQIQQIEEMTHLYTNDTGNRSDNKKLVKRISRMIANYSNPKFLGKMEQEANRFHDSIVTRFRQAFPDLRDDELRLFLYQIFGFSGRTISFLLNDELAIVYVRRSRLKAKIQKSDTPDRDLFLSFFS